MAEMINVFNVSKPFSIPFETIAKIYYKKSWVWGLFIIVFWLTSAKKSSSKLQRAEAKTDCFNNLSSLNLIVDWINLIKLEFNYTKLALFNIPSNYNFNSVFFWLFYVI